MGRLVAKPFRSVRALLAGWQLEPYCDRGHDHDARYDLGWHDNSFVLEVTAQEHRTTVVSGSP